MNIYSKDEAKLNEQVELLDKIPLEVEQKVNSDTENSDDSF